jgi:diguanylate cyclase (GGDEF)-like protein/PAS domain S-box-containing protein
MERPMIPTTPVHELSRLAALDALGVLDTPPEARFDRLTRLAARSFGAPIALVSLVDGERQWFKSRSGLDLAQTPRSIALCSHAVAQREMLVVEDASADPRFACNPLVTGEPHLRFYAGQPLFSEGQAVGTLCILDQVARDFGDQERQCLRDLASLVEAELVHGRVEAARLRAEQALKALNTELEQRILDRTAELEDKVSELSREIAQREAVEATLRQAESWNQSIVASSYSGFVGAGEDGRITEWNASAERIFGWSREQAVGATLSELIVPPALRAAHEQGMRRYLASGESEVIDRKIELPAMTACGRQITVEMTISAYLWQGRRCFGAFLNDISERIRTQQQLEEKQELLDAVLESIDVAVVACDASGNLTLFNRAARSVHGRDLKRIAPADWSQHYALFHSDGRTPLGMHEVPLVRALRGETLRDQAMVIAPQGSPAHTMLASGRLLRSSAGRTLGAVVAMKDITELNAAREVQATNERRLRAITENLPAMIGKVNAAGRFVFLNGYALKAYGKTEDELLGQEIALAYSDEGYAAIRPYIERVQAGERVFFEHVARRDGREYHYQCCFAPQRLADGRPDGFFAMAHDITARKLGELRQAEHEERLRTITDNVPVLIAQLDAGGRYVFANAVHQSWLGREPQAILGQTMEQAFGPAYHGPQREALAQAWRGIASQCEHEIVRGKHLRIAHSTFLPQLRGGQVTGVYVLTTDATASRLHERNLHALAHTDALTGLPNRRHFEAALQAAAARPVQPGHHAALLYLDVDHFKQINDRYGHGAGDAVLVEFSRRLRAAVRGSDLVARLAGDEFTVLLSEVRSLWDVELVARKIIAAVREPFVLADRTLQVTTTIGAALGDADGATPRALTEAADGALYSAKESGRNTYAAVSLGERAAPVRRFAHA